MPELGTETAVSAKELFSDAEVAVLPTGATEQHGPALPLATDSIIASEFAEGVSDRDDVVVLPTVRVGMSDRHASFAGTLSVRNEHFKQYVRDIVSSVAKHDIRKIVVVNAHAPNSESLFDMARTLRNDGEAFVVPWNWFESVSEVVESQFGHSIVHAGEAEHSLVYHLSEELVREDQLEAAEEGSPDTWGLSVHGADISFDTLDFSPNGASGFPTNASPDAGEALFDAASEELEALIDWLEERSFESLRTPRYLER